MVAIPCSIEYVRLPGLQHAAGKAGDVRSLLCRGHQALQPIPCGHRVGIEQGDPLAAVCTADSQVVSCCESDVLLKADEFDFGEIRWNPVAGAILARIVHQVDLLRPEGLLPQGLQATREETPRVSAIVLQTSRILTSLKDPFDTS